VVAGTGGTLFVEAAMGMSAALSSGFAPVSCPWSCVAAFCSKSSVGFFLLLGGIEDLEDE